MTVEQGLFLAVLGTAMVLFLWGRWRHDMVAMGALLACVGLGLVPANDAFRGFGHPAVITVAAILVLSSGLQSSGAVEAAARYVLPAAKAGAGPGRAWASAMALVGFATLLSAVMNNVGALALVMPLAIRHAARSGLAPGQVLMPLAFGSILGGMTTLIGTPPNLIVSGFRAVERGAGFAMFDFTPVGFSVALAGLAFIGAFARWLVPIRRAADLQSFETAAYLTEALVGKEGAAVGLTLREVEQRLDAADAQVIGLVRNEVRITAPSPWRRVKAGDILVIEAEPQALAAVLTALGLTLAEDVRQKPGAEAEVPKRESGTTRTDGEIALIEVVVLPGAELLGHTAASLQLRRRHGINLLAVSREGRRSMARLRSLQIAAGDVLLMQGAPQDIAAFVSQAGCVPLAERPLVIPDRRRAVLAAAILGAAVVLGGLGVMPTAVAFAGGVLAAMLTGVVPPRRAYAAVDWPVIVLLGALMPVAEAMASTGTADLLARVLLERLAGGHVVVALGLVMAVTMTLSDFMNNAATAAVMCPIAMRVAAGLDASVDAFLMAVAISASCAFLTPIGHQNNTLILGPGGFRFGDYWRLGLPMEVVVMAVALPLLVLVWGG